MEIQTVLPLKLLKGKYGYVYRSSLTAEIA